MAKKKFSLHPDVVSVNIKEEEKEEIKTHLINKDEKRLRKITINLEEDQFKLLKKWCLEYDTNITKMLSDYIKKTVKSEY